MAKGILGRKLGMTQIFDEDGLVIPVTIVEATPNVVMQKRSVETDGYTAVQLGFDDKKEKRTIKPERGHANKANTNVKRFVREFREDEMQNFELGAEVKVDIFNNGELIDVTATTKGKGFQGAIKRHGQSRGPETHGSHYHRRVGSMGAIINKVFKGKKLPGHMGHKKRTVQNLEIVKVDAERNLLLVKGCIPGAKKAYVVVRSSVKGQK